MCTMYSTRDEGSPILGREFFFFGPIIQLFFFWVLVVSGTWVWIRVFFGFFVEVWVCVCVRAPGGTQAYDVVLLWLCSLWNDVWFFFWGGGGRGRARARAN